MSSRKILVTGGGGFLGKAIVKRLVARGDQVTSIARGSYPELEEMGVEVVRGDITKVEDVEKVVAGKDLIFHVAAKPGVSGPYEMYYQINFVGTKNIVDACLKLGVDKLVYTSSPSVVFNGYDMEGVDETVPYPKDYHAHYPKTKALGEQYVIQNTSDKLKTISLRPHLIWGPEDNHLVPRILARAKSLRRIGDGKNLVDTIYIDNAADSHILAADHLEKSGEHSGKVYFVSQDHPVALWDWVDKILAAGGHAPITKKISHGMAYKVGAVLEFLYRVLPLSGEPKMTRFIADELATAHWFDISAIKNDLGYEAKVSMKEGLKRLEEFLTSDAKK